MISIVYITSRENAMYSWFSDGLSRQNKDNIPLQIIVVDYHATQEQVDLGETGEGITVQIVRPLPSFCQGPHKLTKQDWWDASIARNTGFVYAKGTYCVFVDDCCVIGDRWLEAVLDGFYNSEVILGAYQKHSEMQVENGALISSKSDASGIDSRWRFAGDNQKIKAHASWFFGCSFAIPLGFALEVNGFDELQALSSYEDCPFGMRLKKAGYQLWYDKRMLTIESLEHHSNDFIVKREDPEIGRDRYLQVLREFGISPNVQQNIARWDVSHLLLKLTENNPSYRSLWNQYDLRQLRSIVHEEKRAITVKDMAFPSHYWATGQPLSDL